MRLFPFLLLIFVCFINGEEISSTLEYEIHKRAIHYYDKYIYSRYLETEKETCEKSRQVIQNLQNMSVTDIWVPLRTVSKQLDKIVEGEDNESCFEEIRNMWNDFVLKGTNSLRQHLRLALAEQEKQQTFVTEVSNNYTLAMKNLSRSLAECRGLTSSNLTSCVLDARDRWDVRKGALHNLIVTSEITKEDHFLSPCATAFETLVFEPHTQKTVRLSKEIGRVRMDLYKCSNKSGGSYLVKAIEKIVVPPVPKSLGTMKLTQRMYDSAHKSIWIALKSFVELNMEVQFAFANISHYLETILWEDPEITVQNYVHAVENILAGFPDLVSSKCSIGMEMDQTIADGIKEIDTCKRTYGVNILQNLSEGEEKFKNITEELGQAGNVALLDCVNDPYTFRTHRETECFVLKFFRFRNKWGMVENELEDIMGKLKTYLPKGRALISSVQICGDLQYERTLSRLYQVLYDYKKCLYLETGKDYNITLSSASIASSKPSYNRFLKKTPKIPITETSTSKM